MNCKEVRNIKHLVTLIRSKGVSLLFIPFTFSPLMGVSHLFTLSLFHL
ncbi:hypothetical protein HMPREF6745_2989 [Prevotella sp. oral taxon 472 str. F0295]|nr:hypothetical protein HMPREF6745_2989 [Prevotella sp. oral taxon 472 str. F0295]